VPPVLSPKVFKVTAVPVLFVVVLLALKLLAIAKLYAFRDALFDCVTANADA
jgi:hypothetical protein